MDELKGYIDKPLEMFLIDNRDTLFENRVSVPCHGMSVNDKISKSIKKLVSEREHLTTIQDIISKYIQKARTKGTLYLSVDPRDYLTLSDNNENWRSCHALDGGYRAGNVNYMVDDVTIVAYLCDGNFNHPLKCTSNNCKWNSKYWRMLIHVSDSCIYFNKQYPFEHKTLYNDIVNYINNLWEGFRRPWTIGYNTLTKGDSLEIANQVCLEYNILNLGGRVYDSRDIVDTSDYLGFCDIIESSSYVPSACVGDLSYKKYIQEIIKQKVDKQEEDRLFLDMLGIKIGSKALCPKCGQEYLKYGDKLLGLQCIADNNADEDFFASCRECGKKINKLDPFRKANGNVYCIRCYKKLK